MKYVLDTCSYYWLVDDHKPITLAIAHAAEMLPAIHNDPADRFVLATAKVLGGQILSPDTIMPRYPSITTEW